jgi:hypothetical protein
MSQSVSEKFVDELVRWLLGFSRCEKLVAQAGDSSGTQRKEHVRRWKPLTSNGSEGVTVDTSVCNSVATRCLKVPNKSDQQSKDSL